MNAKNQSSHQKRRLETFNRNENQRNKRKKCSICLDYIRNEAKLDSCRHSFCGSCIIEWSHIKNICPVCRKTFSKIKCKRNTVEVKDKIDDRLKKVIIICLIFVCICCLDEINISIY
jgi:hypothetical protein